MKSICIIGPAYPYRGGLASYNQRLAEELINMGYSVTLFTFTLQYPAFLFPGKSQFSDGPKPDHLLIRRSINTMNPLSWISTANQVRKLKPKLVICKFWLPLMGPCYGSILRMIKVGTKTKVVSIIDNIIPHEKRFGDGIFTLYFAKSVDAFITMSKSVLLELDHFVTNKEKRFVPHPVYDNYGSPLERKSALKELGLSEDGHYLLFFGFIRDYKGLDLLFKAMADPRIKEKDITLIVAGEFYDNETKYQEILDELNLENVSLHTYFIPDEKVKIYFSACDLVVQPYKSATQSGISQLAYYFEKPMVVTDVGGLSEIVPDHKAGYVVDVDEEKIADAIVEFFTSPDRNQFKAFIKEQKSLYSWENMAINVLELGQNYEEE